MTDYRMGTAMRGRQGTAAQRLTTAQRQVNYSGVGYNTKISAVDRAVTSGAIERMQTKTQGDGRQIYDRNYYYNLLKSKN